MGKKNRKQKKKAKDESTVGGKEKQALPLDDWDDGTEFTPSTSSIFKSSSAQDTREDRNYTMGINMNDQKHRHLHKTQWQLQRKVLDKMGSEAEELDTRPRDFEKFNQATFKDGLLQGDHVPLPDASMWEQRKEVFYAKYIDELGKELGIELDLDKLDMSQLSNCQSTKITGKHHEVMKLQTKRYQDAMENVPYKMLTLGTHLCRLSIDPGWETVGAFVGADQYFFHMRPDTLNEGTYPFWGMYVVCHLDKEHTEGDHVLMTTMVNQVRVDRV
jgi:hypothetical protein